MCDERLNELMALYKKDKAFKSCDENVIYVLAAETEIMLDSENIEDAFNNIDCYYLKLLENDLPVPDFFKPRLLEISSARISSEAKKNHDAMPLKIKKGKIKDSLLQGMLNLVISGASIEKASELIALSNLNLTNGKPFFKASTLEKAYSTYANRLIEKEGVSIKEAASKRMKSFTNKLNSEGVEIINSGYRNGDMRFWKKVIEDNKDLVIPEHVKGNRRS